MSKPGPPRRRIWPRRFEEGFIWPLLDLRDWLFRRGDSRPALYSVTHVPRRTKIRWAILDGLEAARDSILAPARPRPYWSGSAPACAGDSLAVLGSRCSR